MLLKYLYSMFSVLNIFYISYESVNYLYDHVNKSLKFLQTQHVLIYSRENIV